MFSGDKFLNINSGIYKYKLGCCEAKGVSDEFASVNIKATFKTSLTGANTEPKLLLPKYTNDDGKLYTLDSAKNKKVSLNFNKKVDIPKTREVKIPSIEIPIEIIKSKKRLALTIVEAKYLPEGTVLHINPGGLEGSERMAKDGLVLFGSQNDVALNDFNLPEEDCIGNRYFEIKYDLNKDLYKIKNLYGSGLFVKISNKTLLRNNSIFSFSTTHIIVNISMDSSYIEQATDTELISSVITFKYNPSTFESSKNSKITMGRLPANGVDIAFNEESTSRMQCLIFYENNNWYIIDSDGLRDSLNGTWYLADEYLDITENMVFRAGTTSFQANLYDP